MKWVIVGIMLVGSASSQARQSSKLPDPSTQPSIQIGITLQLGMSRDAIITQLTRDYKVQKLQGEGDDWSVAEKESPATWIGILGFHEGKLTYATRHWTQGQEDNYEFAQALWGAMTQMSDEK